MTYLGSRKNSPAIENSNPDLSATIKGSFNILEVFGKGLAEINSPEALFAQDNELNPTKLVEEEVTQTETPLDDTAPHQATLSIFTPGRCPRCTGLTFAGFPIRRK